MIHKLWRPGPRGQAQTFCGHRVQAVEGQRGQAIRDYRSAKAGYRAVSFKSTVKPTCNVCQNVDNRRGHRHGR